MLVNKRKVLLAHEQGTGKTIITIAAAEKLFELGKAQNALIIGRSSDYWQWEDKISEWTDSKAILVEAKKKSTREFRPRRADRYTICPYVLFRNDFDRIASRRWDIVVADEAQEFKNYKAKTAQLIKRLNVRIDPAYRWALTGTSISNHLVELYSIFYWIDKDFLPPWPFFEKNHIVRDELNQIVAYKNLNSLHKYLQARMDRKTHADYKGQLPKLVEQTHKIPISSVYKRAQDRLLRYLDDMVANLVFDEEGNPKGIRKNSKVARAFSAARQELCSRTKLDYCQQLIESILLENESNRVVVFSFYKQPLYDFSKRYHSTSYSSWTGDEPLDQRRIDLKRFASGECRILLASNAGSAGLDLPYANYIIHLDVPFSHGILDQRNKRITRLSSATDTAVVNYLIMQDSLEEFYYTVVKNKKRLADAVQEGTEDEVIIKPESLRKFLKDVDSR